MNELAGDLDFIRQTIENFIPSKVENTGDLQKKKRVNSEDKERIQRVLERYDKYISNGHTHKTAIQVLVHDFRSEYASDKVNRKKALQHIIRNREKGKTT
jgi:hypothetical protein